MNCGSEELNHSPYKPDMAISDYLAFKNLKNLIGHRFSSNSEVTVPVSYW
jgi:hypothetical protein